jgi:hypothetical protein
MGLEQCEELQVLGGRGWDVWLGVWSGSGNTVGVCWGSDAN